MALQNQRERNRPAQVALPRSDSRGADPSNSRDRIWIWLIVLGILLRLALAAISIGTNDAAAWARFGDEINQHGLLKTYTIDPYFNHPPIPGYWAAACARLAGDDELIFHDSIFTIAFKLAPILGDCLATYLLFVIWRGRRGKTAGLFVAAMFSLSLDAIVVSGFHCNTDSLLIALCLLALYLYEDLERPFWSGLALAGAINIKLIPVLLIPPFLLSCRRWRDVIWLLGGLAIGATPFIPLILEVRGPFLKNVLQYNSMIDRWGLNFFFLMGEKSWAPTHRGELLSTAYYSKARYVIFALIGIWAIVVRLKPRWNRYEIALVTFTIFLLFAPGFGVQYTVLAGVIVFAVRPRLAMVYGSLGGLFVAGAYAIYWKGGFPFYSEWGVFFPEPVGMLGLLTWLLLIVMACVVLARPVSLAGESRRLII